MSNLPASLVTAAYAKKMYEVAGKRYQHARADLAKYSLLGAALTIREQYPTATHLIAGISDQGPYLTPDVIIDPDALDDDGEGFDDNEIEEPDGIQDELWTFIGDLDDEDPWGYWQPFVTQDPDPDPRSRGMVDPTGRSHSFALDLDLIIFYEGDARHALVDQENEEAGEQAMGVEETWTCPGCNREIEPSDTRRHASECEKYDGRHGY